jgi:hypothetical protein
MISDIAAAFGLAKDIYTLTRKLPDGLNFNVVKVPKGMALGDHMRIINLLSVAIYAVKFQLQIGDDERTIIPISHVYHISTDNQPFGKSVTYKIPLINTGVFLYPGGKYYVPLSDYPKFNWDGDVRVKYHYATRDQGDKESNPQKISRAEVLSAT